MLLWGQTLAFDPVVRNRLPYGYKMSGKWSFQKWETIMTAIQHTLKTDPKAVAYMRGLSQRRYGTSAVVPYGRFLDIYCYEGGTL